VGHACERLGGTHQHRAERKEAGWITGQLLVADAGMSHD
jgi:hypothetical protein